MQISEMTESVCSELSTYSTEKVVSIERIAEEKKQAKKSSRSAMRMAKAGVQLQANVKVAAANPELIDVLIRYGNNPRKLSPLNYALLVKDFEVASILIESEADLQKTESICVQRWFIGRPNEKRKYQRFGALDYVIADPDNPQPWDRAINPAALDSHRWDMIKKLIENGAPIPGANNIGRCDFIFEAIKHSKFDVLQLIFKKSPHLLSSMRNHHHPIYIGYFTQAAGVGKKDGSFAILELLSEENKKRGGGPYPYELLERVTSSPRNNDVTILKYLVDTGVHVTDKSLQNVFRWIDVEAKREAIEYLIEHGAKI